MTHLTGIIRRGLQTFCLIAIDLCAYYASLLLAWIARSEFMPYFMTAPPALFSYSYFLELWWMPAAFVFFMLYEGLYKSNRPFWDEARITIKALSLAVLSLAVIVTLGKMQENISRLVLLGLWAASLFVFPIFRLWGKKLLYASGIMKERVLILGAGASGRLVIDGLQREKYMGYEVVGFLDDDDAKKGKTISGKKVFGKIKYFPRFIKELGITTAIIAMPSLSTERLSAITASVQKHASNTMVIPDLKGIALLNTDLLHLFYEEIFLMNIKNNMKSGFNRFVKRLFDIIACLAFMPFLLPLTGIIWLIIRFETPGAAIYAHDRIGRDKKVFRCYKFRTMQKGAEERLKELLENNAEIRNEWKKNWKLKDDPRITKTGRFLRKTSLDELPQIFNVIKGEMSLVGPRPYLHREKKDIREQIEIICSTRPGITGLWQVSGRSDTGYRHRMKLDAWYVMNWSLWLDMVIILRTISVIIKREGAY